MKLRGKDWARGGLLTALLVAASLTTAATQITPEQAANHIGEHKTVCGVVASARYARGSRGQPTFLNLGRPFPDHVFTAVIWAGIREKFSYAPEALRGEEICVEGRIGQYRGAAQITVSRPSQIRTQ